MRVFEEATHGNEELWKDDYYKFCIEYYFLLDDDEKKWFNFYKNFSYKEWATHISENGAPRLSFLKTDMKDLNKEIENMTLGEYSLALNYCGGNSCKIYIQHNSPNCNFNKFWVTSNVFINKRSGCPVCKESKGEKEIRHFLTLNNISFVPQYYFSDLYGKKNRKLTFDFGILDNNKKLLMLIEFDGSYHYKENSRNNKELLSGQQYRDDLKNKYCKDNNINLLRIPYWEFKNIEKILREKLL